jgi:Fur family transcriptional regulator, peroxide stress response regulator
VKKSRNTRQRAVILDILSGGHEHLTAEEVYQRARKVLPTVSLGTVYRNLNFLREKGLAREIRNEDAGSARFEAARDLHAHFHCRGCHTVLDIPLPEELCETHWHSIKRIASIQTLDLHVIGDCSDCAPGA